MKSPLQSVCFALCAAFFALTAAMAWAQDASFSLNFSTQNQHSFQLAKSAFLPDVADDLGAIHLDYNQKVCQNYTLSSCPVGAQCEHCPYDITKLRIAVCTSPYVMMNGTCSCPPAVGIVHSNDMCLEYCGDTCIKKVCTPSPNPIYCTLGTEDCDDGCGDLTRKCCIKCEDKITSKPENASFILESCTDGDGEHQIQVDWECNSDYHLADGICEQNCNSNTCSGYDLTECPSDKICEACTITNADCSTDGIRYKAIGCRISEQVDLDTYWCNGALRCWLK